MQKYDAALLVDGHAELVARSAPMARISPALTTSPNDLGKLKPDWIVGAGGLEMRHDAMAAAEGGADYVDVRRARWKTASARALEAGS